LRPVVEDEPGVLLRGYDIRARALALVTLNEVDIPDFVEGDRLWDLRVALEGGTLLSVGHYAATRR